MKQKILYITGYARSGSTAMASLLGDQPEIFAAGELSQILRVVRSENEYCSCGRPAAACAFWSNVRSKWHDEIGTPSELLCDVPPSFRHNRFTYRPRITTESQWRAYITQTTSLLEIVKKCSGKSVVLDSSKSPLRALALSKIDDLDLSVVHLVRDVRGVALSRSRNWSADPQRGIAAPQIGRSLSFTALDWLRENVRANQVRSMLGERCILVRYEDFVDRPLQTLTRVGALLNINMSKLGKGSDKDHELKSGHQIAGNRMRLGRAERLKADCNWRSALSWQERLTTWILASPIACQYGYAP
ncbi:MAG TPA: sulfotransferase [Rhizomicrobium sp.]